MGQPFQFKLIVKYDVILTLSEMSHGGNIKLQSEASFHVKLSKEKKRSKDVLVCSKLRFNLD